MQEAFLHFIWQYQYFDKSDLKTTRGIPVNILKTGALNSNSGPDFSEAQVNLDYIDWRGSVEIHIKSSDWDFHGHQTDRAYDNVILHVVWQHDKEIKRSDGTEIPTIELNRITNKRLQTNYNQLINSPSSIPCKYYIDKVSDVVKLGMLDKVVSERLIEKAQKVLSLQKDNNNDWNETTYQLLSSNFGFKVNQDPFSELSKSLPLKIILKHRNDLFQMEALLFGQAGFLNDDVDDKYFLLLKKEYSFLAHKYELEQNLNPFRWKFMRLRPANFPTVRLAQLAALIYKIDRLFDQLISNGSVGKLSEILKIRQSEYWLKHYNFGKPASRKMTGLGKSSIYNIVINTIIPLLVAYSRQIDDQMFMDRALALLEQLPGEDNVITREWEKLGVKTESAFDTQGLIHLNNNYCQKRRCLSCNIGTTLISKT
ncbi:MAG: DUF2851 family protein [Bacteroidota bacterium]